MSFPNVVKQVYSLENSGLNVIGEYLGYEWNQISEEVSKVGFYAEDGDGAFTVHLQKNGKYSGSEILDEIIQAIFANYPEATVLQIVN